MNIYVDLKRHSIFYVVLMILPPFFLNFLSILGLFFYEDDENNGILEKAKLSLAKLQIALGLTTLMSTTLVLTLVANNVPTNRDIPVLGNAQNNFNLQLSTSWLTSQLLDWPCASLLLCHSSKGTFDKNEGKHREASLSEGKFLADHLFSLSSTTNPCKTAKRSPIVGAKNTPDFEDPWWLRAKLPHVILLLIFESLNLAALLWILSFWN